MSIRTKIVLIVLLLLGIVGTAFIAYSVNTTANYRHLRVREVTKTVEAAIEKVNTSIGKMERNAKDLANAGRVLYFARNRTYAAGEDIVVENFTSFPSAVGGGLWYEPYMYEFKRRLTCFYALRGEEGSVRIDPSFASVKYDYPNQMWYREIASKVTARHQTKWTPPYFDDTGSLALMTTVGVGIYDTEESLVGMSTVDWEIDDVIVELTAIKPTPGSFVLLAVPGDDYVISNTYDPSNPGVGTSLNTVAWYDRIQRPIGEEVTLSDFSHNSSDYTAFSRIMDNGWLLCVPIPRSEIYAEIEQRNARFSRFIGISSLALLALAWYLVNALVNKPVKRLIRDVEELGRGNLDVKIDLGRSDEIGLLGNAFNKMTGDLQRSVEKSARERAERERIAGELNVATRIQTSMLPCTFPAFPERDEFDIYATMLPAREVGGDFYDFFMVDDKHLCVVIADVSGKGIPAALFMVIARTLIKNNAQYGKSPAGVFGAVNNLLCENNEAGMFVTAFMGYLEMTTGKFTYVNAGHNPPLLRRTGGEFAFLPADPGLVLAVMEDVEYEESAVLLGPGDTLYLYTDGVTEAEDRKGGFFTEARLLESINRLRDIPLRAMLTGIKHDIDAFANGMEQADDITMLGVTMAGKKENLNETTLPAVDENLYRAQEFVETGLKASGCPEATLAGIDLAVEEIFVNIAHYAYKDRSGDATIRVGVLDGSAFIIFEDSGEAFDPLSAKGPDIDADLADRPIGGLGVFMVRQIMDDVRYRRENGKNILTMSKRITGA